MRLSHLFIAILLTAMSLHTKGEAGYLGISVRAYDDISVTGLRVVNVFDDGAALVAGIMENDVIIQLNSRDVSTSAELHKIIGSLQWGDQVDITVIRDGQPVTIPVTLGFKSATKTYNIIRSEQLTSETIWYFDDNTTIVMQGETPVSITKKFDGTKETFDLTGYSDYEEVPQRFLDLADKLDVIAMTIEEQAESGSDASHVVFIKNIKEDNSTQPQFELIDYNEFTIFPNPSNGLFSVRLRSDDIEKDLEWNIYDVRGNSLVSGSSPDFTGQFEHQFELNDAPAGTYLLYFRSGSKKLSQSFIIR